MHVLGICCIYEYASYCYVGFSYLVEVSSMQVVHRTIPTKSRRICSVPQCSTYCTKDISLHSFPTDPLLCKVWQNSLKIEKHVTKYMQVCSLHFTENDFNLKARKLKRLKKGATPSRNIPKLSHLTEKLAVNRSESLAGSRLQKCSLDMLEGSVEAEDYENIEKNIVVSQDNHEDRTAEHDTHIGTLEELAKNDKSKGHLVANVPPLTNVTPSRNIPKLSHLTEKLAVNVSESIAESHWLQKCSLDKWKGGVEAEDHENIEKNIAVSQDNLEDNTKEHDANIVTLEELAKPGTSNGHLVANVPPLTNVFSEDKMSQTDSFHLPTLLNSNEKLMHFTGINRYILNTVTKCAEKIATFNNCYFADLETRIILVLCKLKMNISFACLAVLFGIGNKLCSNMFYSTVSLLAVALKTAIYWPTKEQNLNNMPKCFDKFKNTRVVLDCTEIKIPKLKCLKCRVMSYSHYKGTHTIKYLIGITPGGLISFVSSGFGGRASDKAIFNYEKVIDKLEINDAVMVDKGILIEKECEEKLIKLIRPPFLRKQKQFSKSDADFTAEIARARVHVERAIQRIKIFKILQQLEWYIIPFADEIMTIIAAIVNLSPPILSDVRY